MNKKVKIIIMDDVHIEGRSQNQIVDFQNNVKSKIEAAKELNQIPIVVCAGDIGEGTAGIEWAKEFDCDVLYTCGNHEFWNRDYFQTYKDIYEKLKNNGTALEEKMIDKFEDSKEKLEGKYHFDLLCKRFDEIKK